MSNKSLHGKTALVTGATKRIGREIALALAESGANVMVHHRTSARDAEELRAALIAHNVKVWCIQADFEELEQTEQLIAQAIAVTGTLDILVNNASVFLPSTVQDIDFAGLMGHMQVNAWAPFVLGREFARNAASGKIVNLLDSRIAGYDNTHLAYILSKQTFASLTRVMAREFAPGITVNGIAPGLILPPAGKDQHYLDDLAKTIPLMRHGDSADITEAALYLLTNDFVTGQIIFVDGGRHLRKQENGPNHYY